MEVIFLDVSKLNKKSRLLYRFYTKMPCRLIIRSWNNTRNFIQSACSAIKYSKHNSLEVQQCYCLVFSSLLILNILKPLPGLRMLYLCDAILSLKFWSQLICAYIWKLNITGLTVQLSHICERKCSPTQECMCVSHYKYKLPMSIFRLTSCVN